MVGICHLFVKVNMVLAALSVFVLITVHRGAEPSQVLAGFGLFIIRVELDQPVFSVVSLHRRERLVSFRERDGKL
jgi:hypothetical protein